jgi:hypothetical protein
MSSRCSCSVAITQPHLSPARRCQRPQLRPIRASSSTSRGAPSATAQVARAPTTAQPWSARTRSLSTRELGQSETSISIRPQTSSHGRPSTCQPTLQQAIERTVPGDLRVRSDRERNPTDGGTRWPCRASDRSASVVAPLDRQGATACSSSSQYALAGPGSRRPCRSARRARRRARA